MDAKQLLQEYNRTNKPKEVKKKKTNKEKPKGRGFSKETLDILNACSNGATAAEVTKRLRIENRKVMNTMVRLYAKGLLRREEVLNRNTGKYIFNYFKV